jgi:hypothetical protein
MAKNNIYISLNHKLVYILLNYLKKYSLVRLSLSEVDVVSKYFYGSVGLEKFSGKIHIEFTRS